MLVSLPALLPVTRQPGAVPGRMPRADLAGARGMKGFGWDRRRAGGADGVMVSAARGSADGGGTDLVRHAGRTAERRVSPPARASVAWRDHHWTMDLGHLNAELDRLAGAIEHTGGRVTERDLNYVEDSAELFYERDGERYEIHLKRLPDPLPG